MRKTFLRRLLSHITQKGAKIIYSMQGRQIIHFLHIGKTGGSAIKYAISQHAIGSRYAIYFHSHSFRLTNVPKGEKIIFFLRDPISRFVSGFYSRQRQGQPRYFIPWSENEKIAFEEFSTPNQLALALSSMDADKKKRAQLAMKYIQHVRDSYWRWFKSEDYFKSRLSDIFFVGFQERLTEDFEILKSKIGLPESVKLPSDDVQSHRNPAHVNKALEDEAVANLKNWYKDDFQFISLCKQFMEDQDLDCSAESARQGAQEDACASRR
jgi:hypothetical protein